MAYSGNKDLEALAKKYQKVLAYKKDAARLGRNYLAGDPAYVRLKDQALEAFEKYSRREYQAYSGSIEFIGPYLQLRNWDISDKMHLAGIYTDKGYSNVDENYVPILAERSACEALLDLCAGSEVLWKKAESLWEGEAAGKESGAKSGTEAGAKADTEADKSFRFCLDQKTVLYHAKGLISMYMGEYEAAIEALEESDSFASLTMLVWIRINVEEYRNIDLARAIADRMLDRPVTDALNAQAHYAYKLETVSALYHDHVKQGDYEMAIKALEDPRFDAALKAAGMTAFNRQRDAWIEECREKLREKNVFVVRESLLLEAGIKPENVAKMTDDIKLMIMTSLSMYRFMTGLTEIDGEQVTIDYSAVTIPALKACEAIFYHIVGECFLQYLNEEKQKGPLDYRMVSNGLKYSSGRRNGQTVWELHSTVSELEIGSAVYGGLMRVNQAFAVNDYFRSFCAARSLTVSDTEIMTHFTKLDTVREMRNLAAHKNRVLRSNAEDCRSELFDTYAFIDRTYDLFGPLF